MRSEIHRVKGKKEVGEDKVLPAWQKEDIDLASR